MTFKTFAGASVAALLAISPAFAQGTSSPPTTHQEMNKGTTAQPEHRSPTTMGGSVTGTLTLTEEQANSWIDKPVYSSDGKEVGEIVAFNRGADNRVTEMHADIGGLLGLGETRVTIAPSQFKLEGDRAVLNMTEGEAKNLPKVSK